ncbi:helix-turn-helix transcriptional regulator [Paracoccus caeni]|uniref:Helix-turn-helix transcriptional regulator n=1 Tax=Paracoccus caeni TaxID=657651 RepID=A0A934SF57_9RHOB|nr:helix-turn-helix domain-containing protein [Paracoccus caeni]MBK4216250.1 helix-turn-helix transcriptional regulator [Paracoccus caeni]
MSKDQRIRYDEGCLAAHTLNVVGDRWALLVVRELMFTPKRFQKIRQGLPGITAAVLTQRLGQLVEAGVVRHDKELAIYALTDSGSALLPVLQALCHWGALHPGHDPSRFISPTALMISMTALILPLARSKITAGMDFGTECFVQEITEDSRLRVRAVSEPAGDFVLRGSTNGAAWAVYGPDPVTDLVRQGVVEISGSESAAQDFIDLFHYGQKERPQIGVLA